MIRIQEAQNIQILRIRIRNSDLYLVISCIMVGPSVCVGGGGGLSSIIIIIIINRIAQSDGNLRLNEVTFHER
jgi:hypothetical protein